MTDPRLGEFEQTLLFALVRLDGEASSVAIAEEIEERTGRRASPGAVYTALGRMETKGLIESWIGDTSPERGGRRRKCYRLLPGGARALRDSYGALQRMASGVSSRLDALADG
jgi:PadR family transcriptional regulator PadR